MTTESGLDTGASGKPDRAGRASPEPASGLGHTATIPSALDAAITLAVQAHRGQTDKGGQPYILHPLRVMLACKSEPERIVAVLHDTVEDTGLEMGIIRHRFGMVVANAVDALTRRGGEAYPAFIERCAADPIARKVKLADIADNMDLSRLGREPTTADAQRMWRYGEARNRLMWAEYDAQGIEAPSGGETQSGSTVGESPVAAGHAPEPCIASPNPTTKGESK